MSREILTLNLQRQEKNQPWGFRIIGGTDEALLLKVYKVHGLGTPAGRANLQANDAIIYVDNKDVTEMTHEQVVQLIKNHSGLELSLVIERGEHVIPSISDAFPVPKEMKEEDKLAYYEEAMKKGLGGYLMPDQFTSIGKFKVKTPKYNSPVDMYSDQTMDDMICGSGNVDPENLEYGSPAYEKYMKAKRFDPAKSDVMKVLNQHEQNRGDFSVVNNGTENDSSSSIGY